MASFNFVECCGQSYRFIWARRVDIAALSAMAVAVKIVTLVGFTVFDMDDFLRQGLLSLPVYFLEGWVIAQVMVMALYRDISGVMAGKSVLPPPGDIPRNIQASMIVYVLTKLMMSFVVGMTYGGMGPEGMPAGTSGEGSMQMFVVAVMMMVFVIWSFRFLFLYVPMVMGRSPMEFLRVFKALSSSFYLLGVWLLCFMPLMLGLVLISQVFAGVSGALGVSPESLIFESGLGVIHGVVDYAASLVSSVAIALGIYSVFNGENAKTKIW